MKQIIITFLILLSNLAKPILAQTVLKSADLLFDFEIARKSYEQMHPGLYKYETKATIDAAFESAKQSFSKDQTLTEAYFNFHKMTANFKCGHSYPNFFNQEDALKKEVFEKANCLPFHFKLIDDRMLVVRSNDTKVSDGIEILKINGVKISKIINKLLPIVRADGSNDGKRKSLLENGKEYFCYFDIFYPMFFPLKNNEFDLETYDFKTKKKN